MVTVRQALQRVVDHPDLLDIDNMLDAHVHDLVAAALFNIANNPGSTQLSRKRANAARNMIFDRLVGKRRTGTAPARRAKTSLVFRDMTGGELEDGQGAADEEVPDLHPGDPQDVSGHEAGVAVEAEVWDGSAGVHPHDGSAGQDGVHADHPGSPDGGPGDDPADPSQAGGRTSLRY